MRVLEVEIYKLIKSKKYFIFILVIIGLLVFSGINVYKAALNEKPEIKIQNNEKLLVDYKVKAKDETLSDDIRRNYENKVKFIEKENEDLKKEIKNPNYNWRSKLKEENKFLKEEIENSQIALDYNEIEKNIGKIKINNYLLENDIEPRKKYEVSVYLDMKNVLNSLNILVIPILVVILAYDSLSGEYQNSTIKYLMTKPIKRKTILFCKFIALFLVASMSIVILEVLFLIILGAIFNFGNHMYPVIIGTKYNVDKLYNISAIKNSSYIYLFNKVNSISIYKHITYSSNVIINIRGMYK